MTNILIVDDELQVLNELPFVFQRFYAEAQVDTAWSFVEAERLLRLKKYDIVMLDGQISERITDPPEHGFGYNLIPIIKNCSGSTKIIMISTDQQMRDTGIELGADYALSKNRFFRVGKAANSLGLDFQIVEGLKDT